jgi:hypothetical protein
MMSANPRIINNILDLAQSVIMKDALEDIEDEVKALICRLKILEDLIAIEKPQKLIDLMHNILDKLEYNNAKEKNFEFLN